MKTPIILAVLLLIHSIAMSQAPPESAEKILAEAGEIAAKENKKVFILFHASWCGWCKKMDMSMADAGVKKYFDDNYVIRHLVVYESRGKENLENPGALELLIKYKGNDQGIPYWMVFDPSGKLIADSKMRTDNQGLGEGENAGCPASAEEVAHFIKVLKQTSRLTEDELNTIAARFRKNQN